MDKRDWIVVILWVVFILSGITATIRFIIKSKKDDPNWKNHVIGTTMIVITLLFAITASAGNLLRHKVVDKQNIGIAYEKDCRYDEAYDVYLDIYNTMGDWSDIKECIDRVKVPAMYMNAQKLESEQNWFDAGMLYSKILEYQDSLERFNFCMEKYLEGTK